MKKINIEQIAAKSGMSPATVSRVLNGKHNVSQETKEKVFESIKKLGGSPPFEKIIGLIIPDSSNPYFSKIAFQFEQNLDSKGWHLLVSSSEGDFKRELEIISRFKSFGIKGLIYINSGIKTEQLEKIVLGNRLLAMLIFDRKIYDNKFDFVTTSSREGTLQALEYLIAFGHKKIAYLKGLRGTVTATERFESFQEAMKTNRLYVEEKYLFEGNYQLSSGRDCAEELLKISEIDRPTAIICANDLMAIGLMQRLQKAGWILPKQLSVIGFDNIELSQWIFPALSTISQPFKELIEKSVELILDRINTIEEGLNKEPEQHELKPTLVPRESVTVPFDFFQTIK